MAPTNTVGPRPPLSPTNVGPLRGAPTPLPNLPSVGTPPLAVTHAAGSAAPTPKQAAANAGAKTQTTLQSYLDYTNSNAGRNNAQSLIAQLTNPIIAGYTAQEKAGAAAITGLTQEYATQLGQIGSQASADYTTAENQQAALDAAVGQALSGGDVGAAASRLGASLAQAGQNTSVAAQASQTASQTGASMFASGSAQLGNLF